VAIQYLQASGLTPNAEHFIRQVELLTCAASWHVNKDTCHCRSREGVFAGAGSEGNRKLDCHGIDQGNGMLYYTFDRYTHVQGLGTEYAMLQRSLAD
jgi:hypothetical protein